ncbi:MAG: replication-associated recombination protein A [Solirubrobacteraceae bacterium]
MERLFGDPEREPGMPGGRGASTLAQAPLATRLRPRTLDEFVGQDQLLGAGSALRGAIEEGHPHSMILHGPPGSGKTTLARIVAAASGAAFEEESAVAAGRAEVRAVIERARDRVALTGTRTIFFLDEIHRFNKAQQDALLPAVEDGLLTLIGATTENPYFEVNSALLSRTHVYELQALDGRQVRTLLDRAVSRGECGLTGAESGQTPAQDSPARAESGQERRIADEALEFLAERAGGDARTALNGLELACEAAGAGIPVTLTHAQDALQRRALLYDRQADHHYDTISAWIKATRGSDPDASMYYLAVMLEGGEDPRFIVRRMVVLASEDIGNADPQALGVATAAAHAVEHVGLPECQFALAQAAIYLSLAPKSDAAKRTVIAARRQIREHGAELPPAHLRSSTRADGGYDNPHARPGHLSPQELAPDCVIGRRFYEPDDAEAALRERLDAIRAARGRG